MRKAYQVESKRIKNKTPRPTNVFCPCFLCVCVCVCVSFVCNFRVRSEGKDLKKTTHTVRSKPNIKRTFGLFGDDG